MGEYKCPKLIAIGKGQGVYQKVKEHPHYEKVKECLKNDSLCDSTQKPDKG